MKWLPAVVVVVVACGLWRGAGADADADPFLYTVSPWAAEHFGTPEEVAADLAGSMVQRMHASPPLAGLIPSYHPVEPTNQPLLAIRNVKAPPAHIAAHRQPTTDNVQLQQSPLLFMPHPFFLPSLHLRTPSYHLPSHATLPFQHLVQVPLAPRYAHSSSLYYPIPAYSPTYTAPAPAPAPVPASPAAHLRFPVAQSDDDDDDYAEDEERQPTYVVVAHFPREVAGLASLRDATGQEQLAAPAGIVQSTQPTFSRVPFINAKAHPSLRDKGPGGDGAVLAV